MSPSRYSQILQLPLDVRRRALRPLDPANEQMVGMVGGPEPAVRNTERDGGIPRSSPWWVGSRPRVGIDEVVVVMGVPQPLRIPLYGGHENETGEP